MIEHDDRTLVRWTLKGDRKAFEELVDRYQRPVFNVALRMVSNTDDAADLSQTVFVKAYEKLRSYNERYKFYSWLYKIAINASINFLEQQKKRDLLGDKELEANSLVDEEFEARERVEKLEDAILLLRPDYRIVIILKHFQDLSYEEIGIILEIPEKTVKSRLFTARGMLRKILEDSGLVD